MTNAHTFPTALDAERVKKEDAMLSGAASHATAQSDHATQSTAPPSTDPRGSAWPAQSAALTRAALAALARPKVRLALLGVALVVLAAVVVTGSAWTAPLAVAGILMLVVAWFGSRLDGRLMLEWDQSGVSFELKADIKVPEQPRQHTEPLAVSRRLGTVSDDPLLIESPAATVEIDVAELKALIALAEAA